MSKPGFIPWIASVAIAGALSSCGSGGANPNGNVLAAAPSGSATLYAKQLEERHFITTNLSLAKGQPHLPGEPIALPEGLAQSPAPGPELSGTWSPDESHLLLVSKWRKSDAALICELSKTPLVFKELREPDWAPILLGEEQKESFERSRYEMRIESASFTGKDEVLLEYAATEVGGESKRFKFRYRLGKNGVTGPLR